MQKKPLKIETEQIVLDDLRERLRRTRFAPEFANDDWSYGTNLAYLKELIEYWQDRFDWRRVEGEINSFAHYKTAIEGIPIHFIHEPGKGPRPIPLILTHGWPWTFWDFHKVIRPLADPAAHGGDPADAFDVVVPSLPGYGFSTPLTTTGINYWRTADLWVELKGAPEILSAVQRGGRHHLRWLRRRPRRHGGSAAQERSTRNR